MKQISLFLSSIFILFALSSCADLSERINPSVSNAGEVITLPHDQLGIDSQTDTESAVESETEPPVPVYDGAYGSVGSLKDGTVVVSIFASDMYTEWEEDDDEGRFETLQTVRTACAWISEKSSEYGTASEFFYDWVNDASLRVDATFEEDMIFDDSSIYNGVAEYVNANIDSAALLGKYGAQNIVYLLFYNTNYSNQVRPCSLGHVNSPDFDIEFSTLPVRFEWSCTISASNVAHEILHAFGAYDLYYSSDAIPRAYVNNLSYAGSKDIMFIVDDSEEITGEFSQLDAYYTGLTDECDDVAEWGLAVAERFADK